VFVQRRPYKPGMVVHACNPSYLLLSPSHVAGVHGVTDFTKVQVKAEAKFYLFSRGGKGQMP
jgi:hypothetical protein